MNQKVSVQKKIVKDIFITNYYSKSYLIFDV